MDPCVAAEGTISQSGGLPGRYAAALYDLADERRELDAVVEQMEALGRLIDESAPFRRLLASPLVDVTQARTAAQAVLTEQGFGKTVSDFVGVIANNRRLAVLRAIVTAFSTLVAQKRGVVTANVASAHPLSRRAARAVARPADRGRVRQRQHPGIGRPGPARRPRRARRRPPVRHKSEIPAAAPAVRHEGSCVSTMDIRPAEISEILKQQIASFDRSRTSPRPARC